MVSDLSLRKRRRAEIPAAPVSSLYLSISHTTLASLPLSYELIFTPFVKIKYATSLNEMVKLFEILAVGGN